MDMDSRTNGSTSNKAGPFAPSSSSTHNGIPKSQTTAHHQQLNVKSALVRKISGGIKVNTVKRAALPSRSSPLSLPPSNGAPRINGLSEERMQRVEEIRRERERKQREEEERLRPTKSKSTSAPAPVKRRKVVKEDSDDDDLFSTGSETSSKKQKKEKASSLVASRASSVGQGYKKLGRSGVLPLYLVPRPLHDEDAFRNASMSQAHAIQSAALVEGKQYGPFFSNLSEEQSRVQLEYPAPGCSEEFSLLVPRDREEYDPISDLLRSVRCIIEFYLTPQQQEMFGSLDALETGSATTHIPTAANRGVSASREPSLSGSEGTFSAGNSLVPASPATFGDSPRPTTPGLSAPQSSPNGTLSAPISPKNSNRAIVTSSIESPYTIDSPAPHSAMANTDSILRSFTKARNRRDGQLFLRAADRFNVALRTLRDAGKIEENVRKMGQTGVPEGIWRCLQEQCYARTVAPRVEQLSKYEAFSDNVYGELLPRFMSEIAQLTKLGPESVFVDLGSGVGNLLIQVALQTGSEVHGCEQMQIPSELASLQVEEAKRRWKMWGLRGGQAKAWQGDFGDDDQIRQVLRRADVVLVNNYAFTAPTNDRLSWQFLDLKDGAQVVSLKPFVPPDFRLTERTLSSPLAILRVAQRTYTTGCVSWADGGGKYYIHTVDRSMIAAFLDARGAGAHALGDVRKKQWKAANESEEDTNE